MIAFLTLSDPIPEEERKLTLNVYFSLFGGASKGFMKSLKPFEAPQRCAKIKISVNFYFNTTFWNARGKNG